jgi:N6-L-threonylcarbamoyladenine synthase
VVDVIVAKTVRACKALEIKQLILAGGVAANRGLRDALDQQLSAQFNDLDFVKAPLKLCGDNGAMIGAAGEMLMRHGVFADLTLNADPSLEFDWEPGATK